MSSKKGENRFRVAKKFTALPSSDGDIQFHPSHRRLVTRLRWNASNLETVPSQCGEDAGVAPMWR